MARSASKGKGAGAPGARRRSPVPPPGGQQKVGMRQFVHESWGELRKVQWPTRPHLLQGTLVVGVVTAVFAVYLTFVDLAIGRLIKYVLPS